MKHFDIDKQRVHKIASTLKKRHNQKEILAKQIKALSEEYRRVSDEVEHLSKEIVAAIEAQRTLEKKF